MKAVVEMRMNPFENDVVREPRDVSFSVKGLNDAPLARLMRAFARLDEGDLPRGSPVKAGHAQFIVSPDRGYGKSHLLGRLFAELGPKATKVYLRPFQDPGKAWHSILQLIIQELNRPENDLGGAPTQLQSLAVGTLAHIVADFAEDGVPGYPDAIQAVPFLRKLASGALRAADRPRWLAWLSGLVSDASAINRLSSLLRRRQVTLRGREKAWLKILGVCAFDEPDGDRQMTALKWLRAEPLEAAEIALLRLEQADDEGRGDSSAQEINDLSFHRIMGLCQLASYYRPFVFCFDQTEFYGSDPLLVKALGHCIEKLFAEVPNHLTIVTANQVMWETGIEPHMYPAHLDRLSAEIRLEGITIDGARELITARLIESAASPAEITRFFEAGWLGTVYSVLPTLGVRYVLMKAAERFRALPDTAVRPPPQLSLEDLFQLELNEVRSKKALQAYNQDCLMWFVKDIGQSIQEVRAGRTNARRYFSFAWNLPDRGIHFAFEGGDHWRRWQAIADEAISMARARGDRHFWAYVFRTPDLAKIPRPSWAVVSQTLDTAARQGFGIVELTKDQVSELHAARELHSDALQGNIAFSAHDTLAWLQDHFAPFLKDIAFPNAPLELPENGTPVLPPNIVPPPVLEPSLPGELDDSSLHAVLDIVRQNLIVDISNILAKLGSDELRDPLLRSIEAHPNLKAHPGPRTIYVQWRITA